MVPTTERNTAHLHQNLQGTKQGPNRRKTDTPSSTVSATLSDRGNVISHFTKEGENKGMNHSTSTTVHGSTVQQVTVLSPTIHRKPAITSYSTTDKPHATTLDVPCKMSNSTTNRQLPMTTDSTTPKVDARKLEASPSTKRSLNGTEIEVTEKRNRNHPIRHQSTTVQPHASEAEASHTIDIDSTTPTLHGSTLQTLPAMSHPTQQRISNITRDFTPARTHDTSMQRQLLLLAHTSAKKTSIPEVQMASTVQSQSTEHLQTSNMENSPPKIESGKKSTKRNVRKIHKNAEGDLTETATENDDGHVADDYYDREECAEEENSTVCGRSN